MISRLYASLVRQLALVVLALGSLGTANSTAAAEAARSFNLSADAAERSLRQFSIQAGVEVVSGPAATLAGPTNPVYETLPPAEAMARMLAGTGLVARQDPATGAFSISAAPAAPQPASAPPGRPATGDQREDGALVTLSPFEVTASSDVGYQATQTLAGSRLRTDLKDLANQVNVMTAEFMQDLAVTTMDEAMMYSLNAETSDEAANFALPGGAGISATIRPFGGSSRIRGLTSPNVGHDFFDTFIPLDTYNLERLTFASGGNSILFGNSAPSGTIDATLKRAQLARQKYEVSYRIDERGSHRATTDVNVPLKRDVLGLRLAALHDRDHHWRAPAGRKEDRLYGTLAFKPGEKISLRAYYETVSSHSIPVRNSLLQDHVTPWLLAGSPAFNNGGGTAAAFPAAPTSAPFARSITTQPYLRLSPAGVIGPVGFQGNTVLTRGFDSMTGPNGSALDSYEHTVIDPALYPFDVAYSGNGNQSKTNAWSTGAVAEITPFRNFFVEVGYNRERLRHRGSDYFSNQTAELQIDANRFLNDRVTPNPNFGQYYFDNSSGAIITARNFGEKEQKRLSFAYQLDFESMGGWRQWLGQHQISVLFDRLDSFTLGGEASPRVVGDYSFTTADPNSRRLVFRQYIDPRHLAVHLPFDPLADGPVAVPGALDANGRQIYLGSWDAGATPSLNNETRNLASSRSFALQSRLLQNRIVATLGQRKDYVDLYEAPNAVPTPDFFALANGGVPWELARASAPQTRIKGVVVHPLRWASLSYFESDTQRVETSSRRNLTGELVTTGKGTSKEYGLSVRWGDRLSLRLQKYENSSIGNLASGRAVTPTATIAGRGSNFRREVANLERSVQIYETQEKGSFTRSEKYGVYQDALATLLPTGANAGNSVQQSFDLMSDRVAEGYELTVIGNPTPQWRLSVSAARNGTRETNIGPQYFDFIQERLPVWARYLNRPFLPNAQGATVGQVLNAAVQGFNFVRLSEGHLNAAERKYRVTVTGRYTFEQGRLKGLFTGFNYVWRSPMAAGYHKIVIDDNPFFIPGLTSATLQVDDVDHPIYGSSLRSIDAFAGYSRRLFKQHKVLWRVQLNVRNLFDDRALLMQLASTTGITGTGAVYTAQQPRSIILTNTFSF